MLEISSSRNEGADFALDFKLQILEGATNRPLARNWILKRVANFDSQTNELPVWKLKARHSLMKQGKVFGQHKGNSTLANLRSHADEIDAMEKKTDRPLESTARIFAFKWSFTAS